MNHQSSYRTVLVVIGVLALAAAASARTDQPLAARGAFHDGGTILHGGSMGAAAAGRDTVYLLGGPGRWDGRFETADGVAAWHGWTSVDLTAASSGNHWSASTYEAANLGGHGAGNHAMWCGETFANACAEGYGNGWRTHLIWSHWAPSEFYPTDVRIQGVLNHDLASDADELRLEVWRAGDWEPLLVFAGAASNLAVDETVVLQPEDYGDYPYSIRLRWAFTSDDAGSDEDGLFDSRGACQIDDLEVRLNGMLATADDFEPGSPVHWHAAGAGEVGDFAHLWHGLQDLDPCVSNHSWQLAFVDDGEVVPGTGGTSCITWCYGPGGYTVNPGGGLAGPDFHLANAVLSPVLSVPDGRQGCAVAFDLYQHEDLVAGVSPGIFVNWEVRSTADADPQAILSAAWEQRSQFVAPVDRRYERVDARCEDLLETGARWLQVRLRVDDLGWLWGYDGIDATPAPYFDNVALKAFELQGPSVSARDVELAQDSFPGAGDIDLTNLANNWVRFDMARNISPADHLRNDPGDSLVVDVKVVRAGAVLEGLPRMIVRLKANPLFDGIRQLPPGFTQNGDVVDGWIEGVATSVDDRYAFDLPDSTFFFPGDVIHYYFTASDRVDGQVGVTTLPEKLDGFGNYTGIMAYPNVFTVRALPTLFDTWGNQPGVLFWNDAPDRGRDAYWYFALGNVGSLGGGDTDIFETNGASSGVGNGLGGRATSVTMGGYDVLLYTCGDLRTFTLSNGDFDADPSNDIGVIVNWFQDGGKKAFMTGDDLVSSLTTSGAAGLSFLDAYLSARPINNNILPYINNQTSPRVMRVPGNSVFTGSEEWIAYGGCPGINDFDAIEAAGDAERLAQFLTPAGNPAYTYAAALRYTNEADVIILPYDLSFIQNAPGYVPEHPGYPVRAEVLRDVLVQFGHYWGLHVAVPDARTLTVTAGPNPFNPRTTIVLDLPRAGEAALRLYDIRGRLVRTLHDGPLAEGRHELIWNGDDDAGRAMASGVYFYEVKAAGEERIGKLALVR